MNLKNLNQFSAETPRLGIRSYKSSDFIAWKTAHLAMSHPQNVFDRGPLPHGRLNRAWYAQWLARTRALQKRDMLYVFGLFEKESGALIGNADLFVQQRFSTQCALIGYAIHNFAWGRGYATEAVKAIIDLGFARLKLHRIEAGIFKGNSASIAVAKKAGMQFEGSRRKYFFERGSWRDALFYSVTSEEYGYTAQIPMIRKHVREFPR